MRQLDILCIGRQNFLDIDNPTAPTTIYFPVSDSTLERMREHVDALSFGVPDIGPGNPLGDMPAMELMGCSVHQPEYHA